MLNLSFASAINERTRPIMDGTVQPEGITLHPVLSDPAETFWRMLKFGDFDVSEMSISSLLMAKERGADLVAIPAFPARRFMHLEMSCRNDIGVESPSDLGGKRIAVGDYQQTAALWMRGILEHDFGVSQYDVQWYMERTPDRSHASATGFDLPEGITLHYIPPEASMSTMLAGGELDAAMVKRAMRKPKTNSVERSASMKVSVDELNKVTKPAFGDPLVEGKRFMDKHGFLPVNHTYVVRGDVAREHPWVPFNIYKAMVAAKEIGERDMIKQVPLTLVFAEHYVEQTRALLGDNLFPYGINANRKALETLADYSHEQGLTRKRADIDSLFAPGTRDL